MAHRESPCHAKIIVLVAPTQTKAVVTKDGEPIEDGAHETLMTGSSAYPPWFMVGKSAALTLELTQTAVRRVRGEWPGRNRRTVVLPQDHWQESWTKQIWPHEVSGPWMNSSLPPGQTIIS
jgi:hypothetical protein